MGRFSTEICKFQNLPPIGRVRKKSSICYSCFNNPSIISITTLKAWKRALQGEWKLGSVKSFSSAPNDSSTIFHSACNEITRIQNSTRNMAPCFELSSGLVDQEEKVSPLVPLVHAVTGDAINSFPATVADLNGLQGSASWWHLAHTSYRLSFAGASAKAILRALEEPETGTVAECRTRFMIAIGVVIQAL